MGECSTLAARRLTFRILGSLRLSANGVPLDLGPRKQRILLAALLCHANTVVRVDDLIEAIWEDTPPRTARKNLQAYVSALRKIVPEGITHHAYGYMLHATAEELDLLRFDALADAGRVAWRAHADLDAASALLHEALDLWSDKALVDLLGNAFILAESARLDDRFLSVYEDWVDLEIAAGRHVEALKRLAELAGRHPFRERLTAATMTALARNGQLSAALAYYEAHRQFIARELGLNPSPILQALYQEILAGRPNSSVSTPQGTVTLVTEGSFPQTALKPVQLPRRLTDFVGRAEQIAALATALFDSDRHGDVAVISGATGVGKTALAVHIGHLMADRFADGQVFVSLCDDDGRERPWREILAELMRGTGLPGRPPAEAEVALADWRSWVAHRRFLFLLDGAASEASLRRLLPGHGASRTLITSSRFLSGLESVHRVEVGGFTVGEAQALLERILGRHRLAGDEEALRRLVTRCGGLPLAIRRVAAKLTLQRHLPLRDLGDFDIGDSALRLHFDRFHTGLSLAQQEGFRALGALPAARAGYHTVIAALTGLGEPADQILEALMEANLLHSCEEGTDPRAVTFEMPPLAHQYALRLRRQ